MRNDLLPIGFAIKNEERDSESWSYHIIDERLIAYKHGKITTIQVQNIDSWLVHKQDFVYSRRGALNERIKTYDNFETKLSQSEKKDLFVKEMFFDKNFQGLRSSAHDPIEYSQLSCDSLLCVILSMAFNRKSYQDTATIEELLKRLMLMHRDGETVGSTSMLMITDERLGYPSSATALHKLAQVCSFLPIMLSVNESPSQLVSFFKEAAKVWRQRAIKPPVQTAEELRIRAYDLMELGEDDQAEENIMIALSKGLNGESLIIAANILSKLGQYNLAEEIYIKAMDDITDDDLKEFVQESLDKVRENSKEIGLSPAAATCRKAIGNFVCEYKLCSAAMHKPVLSSLAILGNLSIGGSIIKVEELANVLQVCLDSGAKKVLLPITSTVDMAMVPTELMGNFHLIFFQSPEDAVFKALGVA